MAMAKVFSLHRYQLAGGVKRKALAQAFQRAMSAGLFELPGLVAAYLLAGIKGDDRGRPGTLWVYRGRQAWQAIWGTPDRPTAARDYPVGWRRWEQEFLAPLINGDPDKISFSSYQVAATFLTGQHKGGLGMDDTDAA